MTPLALQAVCECSVDDGVKGGMAAAVQQWRQEQQQCDSGHCSGSILTSYAVSLMPRRFGAATAVQVAEADAAAALTYNLCSL